MKAIICGGRDFEEYYQVLCTLETLQNRYRLTEIAHGGCRGADELAGRAAGNLGIRTRVFEADWKEHGRRAGPIRNRRMLREFQPDYVVAFPGGKGTQDMKRAAKAENVPVLEINVHEEEPDD